MIVKTREDGEIGKIEMCRKVSIMLNDLNNIEIRYRNSKIDRIIEYLFVLQKAICLNKGKAKNIILDSGQFADWMIARRGDKISRYAITKHLSCANNVVANIEDKTRIPTIDMFLKIVEALGYTVTIEDL